MKEVPLIGKSVKTFFEKMSPSDLNRLEEIYRFDSYFKDPFNELKGIDEVRKIYEHMFESLDEPRFDIDDIIEQNQQAFVTWDFIFKLKGKTQVYKIHGSTHFKYDGEGKVYYHRDYWDV